MQATKATLQGISIGLVSGVVFALGANAAEPPAKTSQASPAQDQGIEEVVVTATRAPQQIKDVPRSITVISQEELEKQFATTTDISDVLSKAVPGMGLGVEGRTSNQGQNNIRGRRAQFIVDGVVMNNVFLDAGMENFTVSPSQIARMEVIRGGTAVYGFGAVGGIINIITKDPTPDETSQVSTVRTWFQPRNINDSVGVQASHEANFGLGPVGLLFDGSVQQSNSAFDANGNRIPSIQTDNDTRDYALSLKAAAHIDANQTIRAETSYDEQRSLRTYAAVGGVPAARVVAQAVNFGLNIPTQAVRTLANGADQNPLQQKVDLDTLQYSNKDVFGSTLDALAYYNRHITTGQTQDLRTVSVDTRTPPATGGQAVLGNSINNLEDYGARLTFDTPLRLNTEKNDLTWGFDYEHTRYDSPASNTAFLPFTPPISQMAVAAFAQASLHATPDLVLTGGTRYEHAKAAIPNFVVTLNTAGITPVCCKGQSVLGGTLPFHDTVSNVGAVYHLTDAISPYLSYAEGFTIGEVLRALRTTTAKSVNGATDLTPVEVRNYEIGVRGELTKATQYTLAAFYSKSPLGLTLVPDPVTRIATLQRAPEQVWGAEATLASRLSDLLSTGGTVSFQQGNHLLNGQNVWLDGSRIAPLKITAYGDYRARDWLRLHSDAVFSGSRDEFPGSATANQGKVSSIFLLNASAIINLPKSELTLAINNLLNREYVIPQLQSLNDPLNYYAAPGLTFSAQYRIFW